MHFSSQKKFYDVNIVLFSLGLCVCVQFVISYIGTQTYKYYWRNMDEQVYKYVHENLNKHAYKSMNVRTFSV